MSSLEEYRSRIRETDKRLLSLIQERLRLGEQIGKVKQSQGLSMVDVEAESAVLDNLVKTAGELGLGSSLARRVGGLLIDETLKVQETGVKEGGDQLLKEMFELTERLLAKHRKVMRFEVGEPNFPPPRQAVQELSGTFKHKKIVGYGSSSGLLELRKALARDVNARYKATVEPDQIIITPGGRFGIFAAITTLVAPLERVIIPQPAWPAYSEFVDFCRGRVIPLRTTLEEGWDMDLGRLEEELKAGARMLIVNNPANPTGKAFGRKRFEEIIDLCRRYDVILLSDEVYERFSYSKPPSILEYAYDNFIYVNSFSKQFSLTGWRIAYIITSREMLAPIRRLLGSALTCVPEFTQRAALVALKKGRREADRNIKAVMRKVELTCRELKKIDVSFYKPDGTFYVFPKGNKENFDSAKFAKQLLSEYNVSITPGQSFGDYPEFFRLAISLPESEIPKAVQAIGKALEAWKLP